LPIASEVPGVLEHEPGDLTCVVEAGLALPALQGALAEQGQRLSLDPPGSPTLGECLLDDLSGPLRHRFGTMRDLVLGVTVVLPDGLRASSGGKVVKNVAGYDLGKLFCGSRGRLGQVERLALRLHPLPAAARTVVVAGDRWAELHGSQLVPSAVDLAEGRTFVLFEGAASSVDRQTAALGGEAVEPWDELRALQARLPGRVRWNGRPAPLIRPGPRVAYVTERVEQPWSLLAERVVEALAGAACSQT
jgi:glycolate oxidase FAD binding subunit